MKKNWSSIEICHATIFDLSRLRSQEERENDYQNGKAMRATTHSSLAYSLYRYAAKDWFVNALSFFKICFVTFVVVVVYMLQFYFYFHFFFSFELIISVVVFSFACSIFLYLFLKKNKGKRNKTMRWFTFIDWKPNASK